MLKAMFYDWGGLNIWLFHLVNDLHAPAWDQLMLLGTQLGDHNRFSLYLALAGLAAVACVRRAPDPERVRAWLLVMAVFAIAYLLDGWLLGWLKPWLDFPRPPLALTPGSVHVVGAIELHHSLPSGHSSFAMLCAASLWPILRRPGRVAAVCMVIWVGMSRIALGAHFPADVLAGFLSSLLVVSFVRLLVLRLARTHAATPVAG